MECESDESERWEDFFGSSTDLSPSVIAYYDRLSSSSSADTTSSNNSNCSEGVDRPLESAAATASSRNSVIAESSSESISRVKLARPPLPKLPPPTIRLQYNNQSRRNFRVLSPNVQRIISHSNTAIDSVPCGVMDESKHPPIGNESFLHDRRTNASLTKLPHGGGHKFKHPLSKNTCKLSHMGNELVIDDSDAGYATPSDSSEIVDMKNNNSHCDAGDDIEDDHDKTPTNEYLPEIDFEAAAAEAAAAAAATTTTAERDENSNQVLDESKMDLCAIVIDSHGDDEKKDCLSEVPDAPAIPTTPTTPMTPSSLLSLPKNSGSFLHSMFAKSDDKLPPLRTSERRTSQFYVDHDENVPNAGSDVASSTAESTPVTVENGNSTKETDSATVDLKRSKIRPLSSVSISSTSSSSSTGSDEMSPNQTAISYLASVESLADHSETESPRIGNSITVLERSCMEIVDSEQNYVDDLCQVINGYLNNWKERSCLASDQLNLLFGNIEEVCDFNMILLEKLKSSGMEPSRIAKCFIKLQDQFDAYTHYCTSYPDAISLLTTLLQASTTNSLLTSTQKRLNHTLPLGSYLLKPVQRILKYHLLLDNLRKHCDVPEVAQAHEIMKNVAKHIDQVKRNLEQQSRVKELSGILDGWLGPELTVLGDLKLEGMLMENNKPRIVLLFQNMMIITKKKEDNRLQLKTYIQCKDLMLIEQFPGEPASFSVIPYNDIHPNQIKLTARNREQKRQWAQHIKHVMLAHFDIPSRAKELLFKLGEEDDVPAEKNARKWSHSSLSTTPGYLERRNQFRRSESRYRTKKSRELFATSLSMVEDVATPIVNGVAADTGKTKVLDSMIKELQQRNSTIKCDDDQDVDATTKEPDEVATEASEEMLLEADDILTQFDGEKSRKNSALDWGKSKLQRYNAKTLPKRIANLKKKQRSKTLKETSHFYMDLSPAENITPTVLKITESPEKASEKAYRRRASLDGNEGKPKILNTEDGTRKMSTASLASMPSMSLRIEHSENGPTKRDIDIIAELLKHHKDDLDRILKKPPKKAVSLNDVEKSTTVFELKTVEPPPDESPQQSLAQRLSNFKRDVALPEPLYEELLRNVHVPYKFPSPVLNRSASQPQCRFPKVRRPTDAPPNRPDSDYVSLLYTESGELAGVDGKLLLTAEKKRTNFRRSDTNINYNGHRSSSTDETEDNRSAVLLNNSISSETDAISMNEVNDTVSIDGRSELSLSIVDYHKSVDNLDSGKLKLPERRVSDVTGMQHKSIIHKQGGRALGSRIAAVEYADPKLLFGNHQNHHRRSQTFINRISMQNIQLQRDSVLSSTSSNDSVNTSLVNDSASSLVPPPSPPFDASKPLPALPNVDDCYYEKNIDSCLESDEVFRDSAIYSDECNDKRYMRPEHIYSTIDEVKEKAKSKPKPPPKIPTHKIQPIPLRTAPPPPLPAKPINLPASLQPASLNGSLKSSPVSMTHVSSMPPSQPPPPLPPPLVPPRRDRPPSLTSPAIPTQTAIEATTSMAPLGDLPPIPVQEPKSVSSWVLMQIKNFDK